MTAEAKSAMHRIALGVIAMAGLLLVGQALAVEPQRAVDLAVKGGKPGPVSLFELIVKGGYVMYPLGLCSVLALALAVERFISLKRDKILPPEFVAGIKDEFSGADDIDKAVAYCEDRPSPISNIFKAGIGRVMHGAASIEKAIEDAGSREVDKLKRSLRPLSVIATVAPLLGLLGTVLGMIETFEVIAAFGTGNARAMAGGISVALITTQTGLLVAIPGLVLSGRLRDRAEQLRVRLAETAQMLDRDLGRRAATANGGNR